VEFLVIDIVTNGLYGFRQTESLDVIIAEFDAGCDSSNIVIDQTWFDSQAMTISVLGSAK